MASGEEAESGGADVVLLVCVKCGWEVQLTGGEEPPSDLKCEKCGGEVFRRFEDSANPSEARGDFEDETGRDTDTDDSAEDTTRQDLLDLNNP